jgi:hypothetical protein
MVGMIDSNYSKLTIKDLQTLKITEYDLVRSEGINGIYYKIRKYANIFIGGLRWNKKNQIVGRITYDGIELVFKTQSLNEIKFNTPNYKSRRYSIK